MKQTTHLPRARTDGLVINELTDEVLVYDLQRDKAHCLNLTAAAVWKQCDGRSTAAEIARRLSEPGAVATGSRRLSEPGAVATGSDAPEADGRRQTAGGRRQEAASSDIDEQVVWLALEQLSRDHLLEERVLWPASIPRISRREAIRRVGFGAAIALPIVVSITAPTPAQAGTCSVRGQLCTTSVQCCSKTCLGGGTCA